MENRITSLEELEEFKSKFIENQYGIGDEKVTDCSNIKNLIVNRIFTYSFDEFYLKEIVREFNFIRNSQINQGKITNLVYRLREISNDMIRQNSYPLEAILYASKCINNILINNHGLIDALGDLLKDIYDKTEVKSKTSIMYILENWKWAPQLNILINACGKIKKQEFLEVIFRNYHMNTSLKFQVLKALLNGDNDKCIQYSLRTMSYVEDNNQVDNQMCKYFKSNFIISFGQNGVEEAYDFIDSPGISRKAKIEISRALPRKEFTDNRTNANGVVSLNYLINAASELNNSKISDMFNVYIKSERARRNVYVALRWAHDSKDIALKLIKCGLKNYKNTPNEIGEALITLAKFNDFEVDELAFKCMRDEKVKIYSYGALSIRGKEDYTEKLVREMFEQKFSNYGQCFEVMKQCSYEKIYTMFENMISRYTRSGDEVQINKFLKASYILFDNPKFNFREIILRELNYLIGDEYQTNCNGNVQIQILKLIDSLFDAEKYQQTLIPILFSFDKEGVSPIVKAKAQSILKRATITTPM